MSDPHESVGSLVAMIGNARAQRRGKVTKFVAVGPLTLAQLRGVHGDRVHGLQLVESRTLREDQFALLARLEELDPPPAVDGGEA